MDKKNLVEVVFSRVVRLVCGRDSGCLTLGVEYFSLHDSSSCGDLRH